MQIGLEFSKTLGQACLKTGMAIADRLRIGSASYVSNLLPVPILVSSDPLFSYLRHCAKGGGTCGVCKR